MYNFGLPMTRAPKRKKSNSSSIDKNEIKSKKHKKGKQKH